MNVTKPFCSRRWRSGHGALQQNAQTSKKYRLLKFCYVPATSAACNRLLFFLFLLRLLTVLMKQTRQVVRTIKQSIFLRCLWQTEMKLQHWAGIEQVKNTNIKIYLNTFSSKPDPYRPKMMQSPLLQQIDFLSWQAFLALAQQNSMYQTPINVNNCLKLTQMSN